MQLKWSEYALKKYDEQIGYIALRNFEAAEQIEESIENALNNIRCFPELGRRGRYPGTMEFILKKAPLIIVYHISDDLITILNIIHTSQDYP